MAILKPIMYQFQQYTNAEPDNDFEMTYGLWMFGSRYFHNAVLTYRQLFSVS